MFKTILFLIYKSVYISNKVVTSISGKDGLDGGTP